MDEFIRKYYKNLLIRGAIYATGLTIVLLLAVSSVEYFSYLDVVPRTVIFYTSLLALGYVLGRFIVIPLFKLYRIGEVISYEQAASIIGNHFTNVKDKLLNVLQLQHQSKDAKMAGYDELLKASIEQKIKGLTPISFTSAVNISENKKYLKYALVPLGIFLVILISAPNVIRDGTSRLINHSVAYERPAPFSFVLKNKNLTAIQHEDYELKLSLEGNQIPDEVFLVTENSEFKLQKESTLDFTYVFKNIQRDVLFRFSAGGFLSKSYSLKMLSNPIITGFDIQLRYPAYLGKLNERLSNTGDLLIPEGTTVSWIFNTQNTEQLFMQFADTTFKVTPSSSNSFSYSTQILNDKVYVVKPYNGLMSSRDSMQYAISVLKDAYPLIKVEEKKDSLSEKRIYFNGSIKDDHGFSKLVFNYKFLKSASDTQQININTIQTIALPIDKKNLQQQFFHYWDVNELNVQIGDEIEYYFEIFDNDGVNGSKSTRTETRLFKAPTLEELTEKVDKSNAEIKEDIEEAIKEARDMQKDLSELNRKILEKKELSYDEKKKMEKLLTQQKELQKKVENIKNQNEQKTFKQNEYSQADENILKKQQQLEKLFENIMTSEMKQMFEQMQQMMDQLDKNKLKEAIEQMKLSNKDIEKELDRTLEVFKQLEVEQKMLDAIKKLEELSKEQNKLAEESQQKNASNDKLQEKQNELNKMFEEARKDIEEMHKKNAELERPNEIKRTDMQEQDIKQDMQNSSDQLKKNDKKAASKSQKSAAQKTEELVQQMQQAHQQMESENNSEDMNALRAILENLLKLSFDQESLMNNVVKTHSDNPNNAKLGKAQKKLQDDAKMIEDSLLALSKRNPMIEATVNREISAIDMNMKKAIESLTEGRLSEAASRQQFAMTSINNMALLLSESLSAMQQAARQQSKMGGSGSCNKPGGKGQKPGMSNLRQMQEQLNKQMKEMKEGMQKGGKDGKTKGQNGMGGMSEGLAKMAAQQAAIRQELQKMMDQMQKDGKGTGEGGKLAEKMEQVETDIVNKRITQETIKRQEEILTRLLESEKAEREQEMEEKRESNEAKSEKYRNLSQFLEYKRQKEKEIELLRTVPPSLAPFYKTKVNTYFNNIQQ